MVKATNCLIARRPPPPPPKCLHPLRRLRAEACRRTAALRDVLVLALQNFGKAQEYHIFDCIRYGCCGYVCPSRIPLVQYFRFAKERIWARERGQECRRRRQRFEFKQLREEREKAERPNAWPRPLPPNAEEGRQPSDREAKPRRQFVAEALRHRRAELRRSTCRKASKRRPSRTAMDAPRPARSRPPKTTER